MLNDTAITRTKLPEGKQIDRLVGGVPGLRILMYKSAKGNVSRRFYYRYKFNGKIQKVVIGSYPGTSLKEARKEGMRLDDFRSKGLDPKQVLDEERNPKQELTVGDLLDKYVELKEPTWTANTQVTHRNCIKLLKTALGAYTLPEMTRGVATEYLLEFRDKPIMGKKMATIMRSAYNVGIDLEYIDSNPFSRLGIVNQYKSPPRQRILDDSEIRLLGQTPDIVQALKDAAAFQLMTGLRGSEVLKLTWEELDLEKGILTLAPERTKNKRGHRMPVSDAAKAIADRRPRTTIYVFQSDWSPRRPKAYHIASYNHALKLVQGKDPKNKYTTHDLRRTAASFLAKHTSSDVVGKILNHSPSGVTQQHYIVEDYWDEQIRALNILGNHICGLMQSNVVQLPVVQAS